MKSLKRLLAGIILSGTVAGCASEIAKPIGLDVALRGVEEDMKAASAVSLHDVLSGEAMQENEFNFTSISSLPDVYLQQKATYVKDFPDSEKAKYLEAVFKDRDFLRHTIKDLISSYSEQRCQHRSMNPPS